MADDNICAECGENLPTSRGLKIHMGRKHGENNSSPTIDVDATKAKFDDLVFKARPSAIIGVPLRGFARTYHDPSIALSEQEARDLDGVIQDAMAEYGGNATMLTKIAPYLPVLGLIFVAGPILLEKLDKISAARTGNSPETTARERPEPLVADGSHPTISRKDVMPDA